MLDTAKRKEMLRQMILVRAFEEKLEELYQRKAMFGSTTPTAARKQLPWVSARPCSPPI